MNTRILLSFLAISLTFPGLAQESKSGILLTNCKLYTATGEVFEEGAIGFQDGIIDFAGRAIKANTAQYEAVIDLGGQHVYPALIAVNTTLGINEIDAVRATNDFAEVGAMNPNVRSISAFNAESDVNATALSNGVLFAQVTPRGGVLSGTSSVVALSGWNWEDAAYHIDEGIHLNWPRIYRYTGAEKADPEAYVSNDKYEKELREILTFFKMAQAYAKREVPLEYDLRLESMRGLFEGSKRLYVHADFIKEIREISLFKNDFGLKKLSIVGGDDSWMVTDLLKEANISVLVRRVNSLPRFAEDPIDAAYSLAAKLAEAEVPFCFEMEGQMETMQQRNLPFNAGTAIGYGLSKDKALQAMTVDAAGILGIADRTGSLEVGKEANLVVARGDLFEIAQGKVSEVYYKGKSLDLDNRQETLYRKYASKLGLEVE